MSDSLRAPAASNTFERIQRVNQAGAEFWSARELARVLVYREFRNFALQTRRQEVADTEALQANQKTGGWKAHAVEYVKNPSQMNIPFRREAIGA